MFPRSLSCRLAALGTLVLLATVCCAAEPDAGLPAPAAVSARLDAVLSQAWSAAKIQPAPPADDATILRRAWLDLAGAVPPIDAVRPFLADREPAKRARLIDSLLASDDFADQWGRVLTAWATDRRDRLEDRYDGRLLQDYLRTALAANRPYSTIVFELLTGEGGKDRSGPANFLLRYDGDPVKLAGAVGRQFLGISVQCAQCHHHPFAQWTEDDFWGLAACFGRVHVLEGNANGQTLTAIYETRRGELEQPDLAAEPDEEGNRPTKIIPPRLPGAGEPLPGDRRTALAEWVTAADNPYFARHTVNRAWLQLFGQRLAKSLDNLDALDKSEVRAQILELLAGDFTASGGDLKRLVRVIALSRAYQLASGSGAGAEPETAAARRARLEAFALFPVRPLSVDQLYRSMVRGTGHLGHDDEESVEPEPQPQGPAMVAQLNGGAEKRLGRLPGSAMPAVGVGEMMKPSKAGAGTSAASQRESVADMPVEFTDWAVDLLGEQGLTIQRTLTLLNGEYVHQAAQSAARLAVAMRGRQRSAQIEWLFLATLSREPSAAEMQQMLAVQRAGKGPRGMEDIAWALLNSAEFNTNH